LRDGSAVASHAFLFSRPHSASAHRVFSLDHLHDSFPKGVQLFETARRAAIGCGYWSGSVHTTHARDERRNNNMARRMFRTDISDAGASAIGTEALGLNS
jgi:hypothetical protein